MKCNEEKDYNNNNLTLNKEKTIKNNKKAKLEYSKNKSRKAKEIKSIKVKSDILKRFIIYKFKNSILLFFNFFFLFLSTGVIKNNNSFRKLDFNEIILTVSVNGQETISILNSEFTPLPDEIYINNEKYNEEIKNTLNLQNGPNIIKLNYKNPLNSLKNMFNGLSKIKKIDLSNFDSSEINDIESMFESCQDLEEINFENFQTYNIISMKGLFQKCKKITSLDLSGFKTNSVNTMKNMFTSCESLTFLDISNFDTSSVTDMAEMFCNCQNLENIDLSSFSTTFTDMGGMFKYCLKLKAIKFPETNKLHCKGIGAMFQNCQSLTSLNLSCFETSKINQMDYVFDNCYELISVDLSSFETSIVQSFESFFSNCKKLEILDLSKFNTDSATNYKNMFIGCNSLIYLNFKNFKIINEANLDHMFNENPSSIILCIENYNINQIQNLQINCENDCFSESSKYIPETKICLNDCNIESNIYKYEYNKKCYQSCPEGTTSYSENKFLCVICTGYYNMDKTMCFDEIPDGYFLSDSQNKLIDKCDEKCKKCNQKGSQENTNCLVCNDPYFIYKGNCLEFCENGYDNNNECKCNPKCKECSEKSYNECTSCNEGYYQIYEETLKYNPFVNCYNEFELERYYLNGKYLYGCFWTCKRCSLGGTEENNNCDECRDNYIFLDEQNKEKNCYEKCNNYYYFDSNDNNKYKCTDKEECPYLYNKLISSKRKCIDDCSKENKYEYNNICYDECPSNTIPDNYFCKEKMIEITTDLKETETSLITQEPIKTQELIKTQEPIKTQELIKTQESIKTQIPIKTEAFQIQTSKAEPLQALTEIAKNWSSEILSLDRYIANGENIINKDDIIKNIREDIIKHNLDKIISKVVEKKEDQLIREDNTFFQITTSENQNNNNYTNISTIKLGDCEKILKDKYGIEENETLIILKIDYNITGLLIPIIGYEVFHPRDKSKLNLSYCDESSINYNIPVSIDEDNLFKYNPNSDYYIDECNSYTSENGTDILLNDRKEEFSEKNMSLCENICKYAGYDPKTKKALCECGIRYKELILSEVDKQNDLLANNFTIDNTTLNIGAMKCYELLFSKEGLLTNIGSYILISIILLHLISTVIFYKCGYQIISTNIQDIIDDKRKLKKLEKKSKSKNGNKNKGPKKSIYSMDYKFKNVSKKSLNLVSKKKFVPKKRKSKIQLNPSKKSKKKVDKSINQENSISLNQKSFTKLKLKDNKNITISGKEKSSSLKFFAKINNKNKDFKINSLNFHLFNDFEINSMNYKQALQIDKRTYFEFYLSMIRTKHPLIFTFFPIKDFNVLIIKICLFFLTFAIHYAFNTFFFDFSIIHKFYENKGSYDFFLVLPQIIISFILSHLIIIFVKYFTLSERDIFKIKCEKTINKANDKVESVERCLIIKNICYFIISISFLIFFWYYLSSFCALYKNSQVHLIKNTFISFAFCLIYPFFINIIPGIFRRVSLKKKNKEFLYKASKILQLL